MPLKTGRAKQPICFVIMPFTATTLRMPDGTPKSITKEQWDHIYEKWIKRAVESYNDGEYLCKRSPAQPGNFIKGIVGDLATADFVVADLTGERPNVYYELGIRHALRTGTVIITQHLSALPSDLHGYWAFEYEYSEKAHEYELHYGRFEQKLHGTICAVETNQPLSDSPVSDFLGIRFRILEQSLDAGREQLRWLLENIKIAIVHNLDVCGTLWDSAHGKKQKFEGLLLVDAFRLEALYTQFLAANWTVFPRETLTGVLELITFYGQVFRTLEQMFLRAELSDEMTPSLSVGISGTLQSMAQQRKRFPKMWDKLVHELDSVKIVAEPKRPPTHRKRRSKSH